MVAGMSECRKVFAGVTWKGFFFMQDTTLAILDTKKLLRMLNPLNDDIEIKCGAKDDADEWQILNLSDGHTEVTYVLASPDECDPVPRIKNIPTFNAAIVLDPCLVQWFFKAYRAMEDKDTLFTVLMSQSKPQLEIVLGYHGNEYADSCHYRPNLIKGMETVSKPVSFSALLLKEILKANCEFRDAVLHVSDEGLATISFPDDEIDSLYYLLRINTEEAEESSEEDTGEPDGGPTPEEE